MVPAGAVSETSWQDLLRAVRSYVGGRVSNPDERDDLVQEVLLRIHRGLGTLKDQASPGPWVYSIASNAIVDHWRRKGRAVAVPIDEADIARAELPSLTDDSDLLQQAVAAHLANMVSGLKSPYRETLTLTELQGMKHAEAAKTLGISLAAVKSRVLRGRELLRKALLRCCEIEVGATGRVLECTPRGRGSRASCEPPMRS